MLTMPGHCDGRLYHADEISFWSEIFLSHECINVSATVNVIVTNTLLWLVRLGPSDWVDASISDIIRKLQGTAAAVRRRVA